MTRGTLSKMGEMDLVVVGAERNINMTLSPRRFGVRLGPRRRYHLTLLRIFVDNLCPLAYLYLSRLQRFCQ